MSGTEISNGRVVSSELYRSLNPEDREVRLLHLKPGNFTDDIKIRLEVVSIENRPYYEALSYVWGVEKSPRKVLVDDIHKVEITENLDCALRHLRYPDQHRMLWIDALCINQNNQSESNSQVHLMGSIYESATEVLIWLGPNLNNRFTDLMRRISGGIEPASKAELMLLAPRLAQLGTSPWFTRVWVVQELVLSTEDPIIYIGNSHVSWSSAMGFFDQTLARITFQRLAATGEEEEILRSCEREMSILIRFHFLRSLPKKRSLFDRLKDTQSLNATEAHDKIYGLLGITEFKKIPIVPRYDLSIQELLAQATASMLDEDEVRFYFHFPLQPARDNDRQMYPTTPDLPSWVPDLTRCSSLEQFDCDFGLLARYWSPHRIVGYDVPVLSNCSDETEVERQTSTHMAKVSGDYKTLSAAGRHLGRISWVSTPQSLHEEDNISQLRNLFHASKLHGFSTHTFCLAIYDWPGDSASDMCYIEESLEDIEGTFDEITLNTSPLMNDIGQRLTYQALFTTDKNYKERSYHPATDGIQPDDILVALFAIEFPFILRPLQDGTYSIVNAAYICNHLWGSDRPRDRLLGHDWSNLDSLGLQVFEIV